MTLPAARLPEEGIKNILHILTFAHFPPRLLHLHQQLRNTSNYHPKVFIMKKIYLVLFILLLFVSCRKYDIAVDNGCIHRIQKVNYNVSAADSLTAVKLLQQNKIAYSAAGFDMEYFSDYSVGDTSTYQGVFLIQEANGLPILSGDIGYQFKNGVLQPPTSGTIYGSVTLDTHPSRTLPQLKQLFITAVNENYRASLYQPMPSFKDSCVVAEFGYYDLNVNNGNNHAPNIVKAWSISPTPGSYPQVIVRDDNGKLILYNGGFMLDN
jgi:hypothetical protein